MEVKAMKLPDEFLRRYHAGEDKLCLAVKGRLRPQFRGRTVTLAPGGFIIVPHSVAHCPTAGEECHVVLPEGKGTLNTGNVVNERMVRAVDRL